MRRGLRAALLALPLACASGGGDSFRVDDLPSAPMALSYRTSEEVEKVQKQLDARKQHEAEEKAKEVQRARPAIGSAAAIREAFHARAEEMAAIDLMARLALYTAPTAEVVDAEFAAKSDRPLAWSLDHQRLLFLSERGGETQLVEWNRQSDALLQITSGDLPVLDGCYGPKGELAFSLGTHLEDTPQGVTGGIRIFARLPGGGEPQPITPGPLDVAPTWSPTQPLLVYQQRASDGLEDIVSVNPYEPGPPHRLARGRSPVFSVDGAWVLYSSRSSKGWKIFRMRPDGSGRQPLVGSGMQEVEPAVSPDGRFFAFVGYYPGKESDTELYVMPINGGNRVRKLKFDDKPNRITW